MAKKNNNYGSAIVDGILYENVLIFGKEEKAPNKIKIDMSKQMTPQNNKWEKEFDKKYPNAIMIFDNQEEKYGTRKLKDIIKKVELQAKTERMEKLFDWETEIIRKQVRTETIKKIKDIKEKADRLKLDIDVIVCDCGEKYKDSDLSISMKDLQDCLKSRLKQFKYERHYTKNKV